MIESSFTPMTDPSSIASPISSGSSAGAGVAFGAFFVLFLIYLLFIMMLIVIAAIGMWKVFAKAGKPGWAALVPIYNVIVFLEIIGRPTWWIVLLFIPIVNLAISIITAIDLAISFGKSETFGIVGLWLFSLVGYLMLGFGDAKYVGPAALANVGPTSGTTPPPASAAKA